MSEFFVNLACFNFISEEMGVCGKGWVDVVVCWGKNNNSEARVLALMFHLMAV